MSSTPLRKFSRLSAISSHLKCPICLDVYMAPMRLSCGHTFCGPCLKKYIEGSKKCPECRRPIEEEKIGQDRLATEIINELEVFCPASECPWKGELQALEAHIRKECLFRGICENGDNDGISQIDEDILDKINENIIKGSLAARIANKASLYERYMVDFDPQVTSKLKNLPQANKINLPNSEPSCQKKFVETDQEYKEKQKNGKNSSLQLPQKPNFTEGQNLSLGARVKLFPKSSYLEELFDEPIE